MVDRFSLPPQLGDVLRRAKNLVARVDKRYGRLGSEEVVVLFHEVERLQRRVEELTTGNSLAVFAQEVAVGSYPESELRTAALLALRRAGVGA